jgi:flagellar hook-length control protein FliK
VPSQTDTHALLSRKRQELSCHGSCFTVGQTRLKTTMNLSSYLQMPPAPLVPNSTPSPSPQGDRLGAGAVAGGNLGFDFADIMARQLQRLVPQQRQTIAADAPQTTEPEARTQDSRPVEDWHSANRTEREAQTARTAPDNADLASDSEAMQHTHQRSKNHTHKNQRPDVDTLLEGLMQGAPVAPMTAAAVTTPLAATEANLLPAAPVATAQIAVETELHQATALQTVELSPQMRIITDPKKAPSPESLAAFAKSMGLDESAIENLLAQQPVTPATVLAGASSTLTTGLTAGLSLATSPNTANTLQAAITALPSAVLGNTNTDGTVATQLAAMAASAQQPAALSGAGLAAAATTSAAPTVLGLTPTDMTAIQQLQITVLPAAVLPVNTPVTNTPIPRTVDMLSLLGTGVNEQDVSALLSRFSEDAGSESGADQQASQGEGHNLSSFAQALGRSNNTTNATASAAPTGANMSEVYDQLSDKMATEMAARMHKQLSDGEWKMKFALRPSNLGGVEIQLEMKDGKLDAVFRADNPLTRDLLQNSSQRLREALGNFGINAGQVNVGQGGSNAQHNNSGGAGKQSQVRDNPTSQVNGTGSATSATSTRNKANASLLDLYA